MGIGAVKAQQCSPPYGQGNYAPSTVDSLECAARLEALCEGRADASHGQGMCVAWCGTPAGWAGRSPRIFLDRCSVKELSRSTCSHFLKGFAPLVGTTAYFRFGANNIQAGKRTTGRAASQRIRKYIMSAFAGKL